jgi:hypothetical protein
MKFVECCFLLVLVLESQRRFVVHLTEDSLKSNLHYDSPVTSDPNANHFDFMSSVDESTFVVELYHFRDLFNKKLLSELRIAK